MSATQRFLEDCATKIDAISPLLGEEKAIKAVSIFATLKTLDEKPSERDYRQTEEWIGFYYREYWKPVVHQQ